MNHALSSSKMTFFYKRIFPIRFGVLALLVFVGLRKVLDSVLNLPFVIVPVLMGIFSYQ